MVNKLEFVLKTESLVADKYVMSGEGEEEEEEEEEAEKIELLDQIRQYHF
jgi:hypothetical protein